MIVLPSQGPDREQLQLLIVLAVAVWLLGHPWVGVAGDGRLYAAQALRLLNPERYAADLYFLYGSQDEFTLFSPLYAAFIRALGLQGGTLALWLLGQVAWVASTAALVRQCFDGWRAWLAFLVVASAPSSFSLFPEFIRYADPTLTPRLFAESLVLLSVALTLRARLGMAAGLLAAATVLHPLMALAGWTLWWIALWNTHRWPAVILGGGAMVGALIGGALGVRPFDRLWQIMDPAWYGLIAWHSPFLLWDALPPWEGLGTLVVLCSVLGCAVQASVDQPALRRLWLAALAVTMLAIGTTWAGTALTHNLLVIQVQPWRLLWLARVLALLALVHLLTQDARSEPEQRAGTWGLALAYLMPGGAGAPLALASVAVQMRRHARRSWSLRLFHTVLIVALCAWPWLVWRELAMIQAARHLDPIETEAVLQPIRFANLMAKQAVVTLVGLAMLVVLQTREASAVFRRTAKVSLVAGLCLAVLLTNRSRPEHDVHFVQPKAGRFSSFESLIPAQAVVHWEDHAEWVWFSLGRSSYISTMQTIGQVFSRNTALEGDRRRQRLKALGVGTRDLPYPGLEPATRPQHTAMVVRQACEDPVLNYLILAQADLPGWVAAQADPATGATFHLYECARVRN